MVLPTTLLIAVPGVTPKVSAPDKLVLTASVVEPFTPMLVAKLLLSAPVMAPLIDDEALPVVKSDDPIAVDVAVPATVNVLTLPLFNVESIAELIAVAGLISLAIALLITVDTAVFALILLFNAPVRVALTATAGSM